jgi:LPS-assembly protein
MLRFIAILLLSGNLLALCVKPIFTPKIINPNLTKADISATSTQLNDNLYNLSGGVEINTNKYYLTADEVVIDNQTKNYKVSGNIKMQVANLLATSDKLSVDNSAGVQLSANNLTYNYLVNNIKGNATQVSVNNGKEILTNASYSSCALESPKWQLRAENITLNKAENLGEAENVSFEFFGMPLFWLPKYQWVLEGRQSGLLAPEFSSYSIGDEDGYSLSVPYYFNLATEKDLTLTLNNLSTRGQVLKTQYRHLLAATKERGYLEINADYLAKDDKTKDDRWLIQSKYNTKFGNFGLDTNLNRVSDKFYFAEIDHTNTHLDSLNSNIDFYYDDNSLYAGIFSEKEQLISGGGDYTKDLELTLKKSLNYNGINYDFSLFDTKFNHQDNTQITGKRTYGKVDISKTITQNNTQITPSINFNSTHYNLDDRDNKQRNMYGINIDSKIFFDRQTSLFGRSITQNLTPRIAYFYNPDKSQDDLPNFDSTLNKLSYNSLFANNAWSGLDRVDVANNIALGFNTNLVDNTTGHTYLQAGVGQNFNLENGDKSNLFAELELTHNGISIYNSLEYDNKIMSSNSLISYKNNNNFLSIGHHNDSEDEYLSTSAGWEINGKSHIFAEIKRALNENKTNSQTLGFMYDTCCFALRLAHFDSYNSVLNVRDKQIKLEMIFKQLGTTDSDLYNKIKDNIPNYINNVN